MMLNEVRRKPEKPRIRGCGIGFFCEGPGDVGAYGMTRQEAWAAYEALKSFHSRHLDAFLVLYMLNRMALA